MKKILLLATLSLCICLTSCHMKGVSPDGSVPQGETTPSTDENIQTNVQSQQIVPAETAKKTALDKVPGSQDSDIREWRLEHDDGRQEYEGKIIFEKTEYEFEIDAITGEIISWESESVYD